MVITIGVIISGCNILFFFVSFLCENFYMGPQGGRVALSKCFAFTWELVPCSRMQPSYCIISYYEFHAFKK